MTNFEKWQEVTSGLSSPNNYIEWGWIACITAALQRRVWCGPAHMPCYANTYIILVGNPGIGKGLVIKRVDELLRHHKLEAAKQSLDHISPEDRVIAEATIDRDMRNAQAEEELSKNKETAGPPLLIPMAANAVTYEALVQSMARCYRRINYEEFVPAQGKKMLKIYTHSSLSFCLEEIASLFRKKTEDLVNFLLEAYDCKDYEYVTISRGRDRIRKCCLNFFGATTPDFMQNTFDDKLLNQGFSSRTFYIYANRNRKNVFWIPELTETQKKYQEELKEHVKKLTALYGHVEMGAGVEQFLNEWWDADQQNSHKRSNKSMKLLPYYARKNIHVIKIAMALHFSESTEMRIELPTFQRAIEFLAKEEKNMHLALTLEGDNPLAVTSRKILEYLKSGPKNMVDLMTEFWGKVRKSEMEEILTHLIDTEQIKSESIEDPDTKETTMMFGIARKD